MENTGTSTTKTNQPSTGQKDKMVIARNITKRYKELEVLKGISLEITRGQIVSIVGSSGAGKTTLLQILGSLDMPDTGEVIINNVNIKALSEKKISDFRNKNIGFVFQFHQLLPEFTALENVCIPAFIGNSNKKTTLEKGEKLLDYLGLKDRLHHKPNQLSGGEQQRVAVARALINDPAVILADEPSGNLDSKSAAELHQLFFNLRAEFNQTFIIVTHNEELAAMADRTYLIKDGKIVD